MSDTQLDAQVRVKLRELGASYCYDLCRELGHRRYLDVWEALMRLERRHQVVGEDDGRHRKLWSVVDGPSKESSA